MNSKKPQINVNENYKTKYGFNVDEKSVFKAKKGLDEDVIRQISKIKNEPTWMLEFRLKAYKEFLSRNNPNWGANISGINFNDIYYYLKPTKDEKRTWDEVPAEMKETFDKLGVPKAERAHLAGVKAQFDSEVIYGSLRAELEEDGVIFMGTDEALKKHPEFFKEYFGKLIPYKDNKYAALNSAVWSGGSFLYIPKGVHVKRPLQAYFRINAIKMGQFERTLIIADEGSYAHYVEGCFTAGHKIASKDGHKLIEDMVVGDKVLTHKGVLKNVYHTQIRPYTGDLYTISVYGMSPFPINCTKEHPLYVSRRKLKNERNKNFDCAWVAAENLKKGDYLAVPINSKVISKKTKEFNVLYKGKKFTMNMPLTNDIFRLFGYYLAEGSIEDRGYLKFSFGSHEREYIEDVKNIIRNTFNYKKFHEFTYKDRNGVELVISSAKIARIFKDFGTSAKEKSVPLWIMNESLERQKELIVGYYRGDGNYYNKRTKHGRKELFRMNTISENLAWQVRDVLLRLGIVSFINARDRSKENRQVMYTIGISGEFTIPFGGIVSTKIKQTLNNKKRATMFFIDKSYAYFPIREIQKDSVRNVPVYNFSVEEDESYTVNSIAAHNCTAPVYSKDSLHAAVVEVFVKPDARFRYSTIQNWSSNVYNLVTKRARVENNAVMEWVDGNLGSRVTMKYPSCYLAGEGAHGEVLSIAYAGNDSQHQDAGAKMIHIAPNTTSTIVSKSVSVNGGRSSYRGLVQVLPSAKNAKSRVECDALVLDEKSATDTFPVMRINEDSAQIEHEATVSKIGEEKLFYLMSRGLTEVEAMGLIVSGFIEPIVKELPLEYAVELNRLIDLEMEGSVG